MHAHFMKTTYTEGMGSEIIQARGVPASDAATLRVRAASRNMSLSAYLRELIHDDASRPTMADTLARVGSRRSIEVDGEQIRAMIAEDRR